MINLSELPASALAIEISAKFDALMRRGGRIDQILAGGAGPRQASLPDEEVERILQNLETQLSEYKDAMSEALEWHQSYKNRHKNKGFRCAADNKSA